MLPEDSTAGAKSSAASELRSGLRRLRGEAPPAPPEAALGAVLAAALPQLAQRLGDILTIENP